jgi:hypothetical protein
VAAATAPLPARGRKALPRSTSDRPELPAMNDEDRTTGDAGIAKRTVEIGVALLLLAFGATVVFDSYRLGASWGSDGPQSGYFPFYIGALICVSAVATLAQVLIADLKAREGVYTGAAARVHNEFVSRSAFRQVLSVLLPAAVYVLFVQLIGIYVASAAYIAIFMIWLGKYPVVKSAAIGVAVAACTFVMFEVWFKVPLYKGIVDPLAWLGY